MDWHRHFGLVLCDFFSGSPFTVELEKDLSIKKQSLDVVIVRKGAGRVSQRLPDGLDDLINHNLITFKSHQEALDDWALKELTGHYVNYRKQVGPSDSPLLPETEFRLYAVCSRFPHNLAATVALQRLQQGVYACHRGTDAIRVVVAGEVPEEEHNAPLHLFSALKERLAYGASHYRPRSAETSTLVYQLFQGYAEEGLPMPYTMEDFKRDFKRDFLKNLSPEELQDALHLLSPEQLQEALQGLSPDQLQQALQGVPPEQLEEALERKTAAKAPQPKKPRGKGRGKQKP